MNQIAVAFQLLRHMGPKWAANRVCNAVKRKIGHFERAFPQGSWDSLPLEHFLADKTLSKPKSYFKYRGQASPRFFFSQTDRLRIGNALVSLSGAETRLQQEVDAISRGEFRYFECHRIQAGFPPNWHRNPFTHQEALSNLHWSRISDFEWGDIKAVWELSRFSYVFKMVRAYWRWGDEQIAEDFWTLVEDWHAKNPPNTGANWKCGQETAFRVIAWCFGLYGFWHAPSTTPQRITTLAQMIAMSAERIDGHVDYALTQRNNHGISEALGLWSVGILFPEYSQSERWEQRGRELLERLGRELIYDDGSFVQHSVNYHRLMLHDYLWVLRLADLNGKPFSDQLKERFGRAVDFLLQVMDERTGRSPYFGQNDGALILPLNACDYQDFRPVVQAGHYYCHGTRCFDSGPWDEDLLWLFGPDALTAPVEPPKLRDLAATDGGYYTLRSPDGFAFVRCPEFKDRPSQADVLHVDLWWKGHNVAMDAGTHSYNAPAPWDDPLSHTGYHNTVTVDGQDQMKRVSKFIWLPWLKGRVRAVRTNISDSSRMPEFAGSESLGYWEGEHDGYKGLAGTVGHRRSIIRLAERGWMVLDRLTSNRPHAYRLHWLLPNVSHSWIDRSCLKLEFESACYHVRIGTDSGLHQSSLVVGDQESPRGWKAHYYRHRQPALSLEVIADASSVWFWTVFSEDPTEIQRTDRMLKIDAPHWNVVLTLGDSDKDQILVRSISLWA